MESMHGDEFVAQVLNIENYHITIDYEEARPPVLGQRGSALGISGMEL